MAKKENANPIPEKVYNRFKYRLEEISEKYPERNLTLFLLGIATGFRIGDIVGLTIGDIKEAIENGEFNIQESKQFEEWKTYIKKHPDSKRRPPSSRKAPIGNKLKAILELFIKSKKKSEYAFSSNKGKDHITAKSYSNIISEVGKELGLKKISGHSLRKTYAQRIWVETRDLEFVREALGHKDIETTKKYLNLYDGVKSEAAGIADNKL